MASFYYATHRARVPDILRNGIGFQGGEHVVFVLGSAEAATRFGRELYGAEAETLEINAAIPSYDVGADSPIGFTALSRSVPANAISRMTPLKSLREEAESAKRRLKVGRNGSLSARVYTDIFDRRFMLCRRSDLEGNPYVLTRAEDDASPAFLSVRGTVLFGRGRSWSTAEAMADWAVTEEIKLHRDLPQVKVFHDEASGWETVQEGFNGIDIEIWHVSDEAIARGVWGNCLEEEGWYWQRMDRQGIHGPFDDPHTALRDTEESYESSGILRPSASLKR